MSRLVLHRKEDENVVIHKDGEIICLVKLTETRRSSARLLFEASDDVDIDREEVFQRKYNIA